MDLISPELTTFRGIEKTARTRIRRAGISIDKGRGNGHTTRRAFQLATNILVEDDVAGEGIPAKHVTDSPANTAFLVAYKYRLKTARTAFRPLLGRDNDKALAPPCTEMRKIGLDTFHDLEGGSEQRKSRSR
jgi:hypothetical protein